MTLKDDYKKLGDWGKEIRKITGKGAGGLRVYVTGDAGFEPTSTRCSARST